MADLVQTAASVVRGAGAVDVDGIAGATLVAGQPIYRDSTDSYKWKLAQKDGTAAEADVFAITLHGAASGQPIKGQTEGRINLGATLTVGETYIISATAGAIAPIGDVSTHYVTILGVAVSASLLQMKINVSGVQHA